MRARGFAGAGAGGLRTCAFAAVLCACVATERDLRSPGGATWIPPRAAVKLSLDRPDASVREPRPHPLPVSQVLAPGALRVSLAEVLRVAGDESLALAIARERARMASADEQFVLDSLFPTFSLGMHFQGQDGQVQNTAGTFLTVDRHNTFAGVITEARFDPTEIYYRLEEAEALAQAAVHAFRSVSNNVLRDVANLYVDLVEAHVEHEIARGSVRRHGDLVQLERARLAAGSVIESQVIRAEARLARARREEIVAMNHARAASAALVAALGLDPAFELHPSELDFEPFVLVAEQDVDRLIELAELRRPELFEATARRRAALEGFGRYEADWLVPELVGTAQYGGLGENEEDLEDHFQYAFGITWNLILSDLSQLERTRANHRRAVLEEEAARRRVVEDVVVAHDSVESANLLIASALEEVWSAADVYDSLRVRYENGDVDQMEVLLAELDLVKAQDSLASAVADHNRAQYDLLRAIGGPLEGEGSR